MNLLDHAIGFQDEQVFRARKFNNGAIVSGTGNHETRTRQIAQQGREERIFAHTTQFHC